MLKIEKKTEKMIVQNRLADQQNLYTVHLDNIHVGNQNLLFALQMMGVRSIYSVNVLNTKEALIEISSLEEVKFLEKNSPLEIAGRLARVTINPVENHYQNVQLFPILQRKIMELQDDIHTCELEQLESHLYQTDSEYILTRQMLEVFLHLYIA